MLIHSLKFLIGFILIANSIFAQNIHYYGWDSMYHHHPNDIVETQNGNFLIIGDVNLSGPVVENFILKKYIVRIESDGDTLWTRYHNHDNYGGSNVVEGLNNEFLTLGSTGYHYQCGFMGQWLPFYEYCTYNYSSTGVVLSYNIMADNCDNTIYSYLKNDGGGITTVQSSNGMGWPNIYTIKELLPNGQLISIPFPSGLVSPGRVEKNISGYWLLQSDSLHRLDLNGNIVWQTANTYPYYISDYCKVNADDLVIVASNPNNSGLDTTAIVKTDSFGNPEWAKTFYMKTADVMYHSSGNYILTGTKNNDLSIMVVSPDGDSLWSRIHPLTLDAKAIKTIEASDGRIVTLAQSKPDFSVYYVPSQYVVVFDSLDFLTTSVTTVNEDFDDNQIEFYPNPTDEVLYVRMNDFNNSIDYRLEIYNSIGQLVNSHAIQETLSEFNFSNLVAGVYALRISTTSGVIFQDKLIKR